MDMQTVVFETRISKQGDRFIINVPKAMIAQIEREKMLDADLTVELKAK